MKVLVITVGSMNPQGSDSQTELLGSVSHTLSVTFVDGYNDHGFKLQYKNKNSIFSRFIRW